MSSSWLRRSREAAGFKQEALAVAVGLDVRAIRRLESCSKEAKKQVPYAALAEVLDVCEIELAEDHARDLKAAGQDAQAQRALDAADKARRAKHFPGIDPGPIRRSLVSCRTTGLPAFLAEREGLPDEQAQAERIAALLGDGHLNGFARLIDPPLRRAIGRAADRGELDALQQLVIMVVQSCAANGADVEPGRRHRHQGERKAWAFRALIDRADQLNGLQTVRPVPGASEARLDDGIDSTRAVRFGAVTMQNVDKRLHELVCRIGDTLGTVDHDKAGPSDTAAFSAYCSAVNNELFRYNYGNGYVFGLWDEWTRESDTIKERLMELLPNLRLFDCGDPDRTSSVLCVERDDREKLETWLASQLRAIEERRAEVPRAPDAAAPATESSTTEEQPAVQQQPIPNVQLNLNLTNGNGNTNGQATGDARVDQRIAMSLPEQVAADLERLLAETRTDTVTFADLRKATRTAQDDIEASGQVSGQSKSLLQRAVDALPKTEKAIGVAAKVADLLAKLPGIGS